METVVGILIVIWLIGWAGTKLGFFKDGSSAINKKEEKESEWPLAEYDVVGTISKLYKAEYIGPNQHIDGTLKYAPFRSAHALTRKFMQNGLVAKEMYGKIVAISDKVSSIGSDGGGTFIRIGDGKRYGIEGTGNSEENMYTCYLDTLSLEQAKTLKAKDDILVIGVLGESYYKEKELREAVLLEINDKYPPKIEDYVRKRLKD